MSNKLTKTPEWKALTDHHNKVKGLHIRDLFSEDVARFDHFNSVHEGLLFDYSKHGITQDTLTLLLNLAGACDLESRRNEMFDGKKINSSENRAVLHTALRRPASDTVEMDGKNITPLIHETLENMKEVSDSVRKGEWKGYTGKHITDIVTIGIGGSIIGPQMAVEALKPFANSDLNFHFVANVDSSDLSETLRLLHRETTLFIVSSKTFTTQETLTNAQSAKDWLCEKLGSDAVEDHFIAVTADIKRAEAFGIDANNILPLWDWVGGRYSLWSSIGLPICIAIGFDHFQALLDGAHSMDKHFQEAPLERNIPVIMGLIGIWHRNFCDSSALAILPYDQYLSTFPTYVSQIDMESNGKSVDRDGQKIDYATSPVIFGEPGTNGQHAFYQALHQGTDIIPCDFIITAQTQNPLGNHHDKLMANAIGQTQALMQGQIDEEKPYKNFEGNRPSSTIILGQLDPYHLGMLLALYEHKIFVQGAIWNINSFDQWGVELGKMLAQNVLSTFDKKENHELDSSTRGLIEHIRTRKKP
ncbi:MAG: glucose-6-phosphate isomerase [Micavibrio sp.]|nr:MAG: glucose-6-phosphate isomerase [Micavibrio sp.]